MPASLTPAAGDPPHAADPMDDYRRCEAAMRQTLAPYVVNGHDVHALASALMTHAQQFALAWARLYRELDERR